MRIKDSRKTHFFWAYDEIFDTWGPILKANGIAVYLCLVRHANNNGTCYPSYNTIAKKCGISRSTVIRTISILVELGLIKCEQRIVEHEEGNKEKISNLYTILDLPNIKETLFQATNDAISSVTETLPPCQNDTTPSVTETSPSCQNDTTPSVTKTPKGIPNYKENKDKEINLRTTDDGQTNNPDITRTHAKSKNNANSVSQSSVDLNLSYLNWPKNLNQSQPIKVALLKLPGDQARQQVLDVVADASKKGTLKKPVAFLRKVVQNYLDGDFTPVEKTSNQTHVQSIPQEQSSNNHPKVNGNPILATQQNAKIRSQITIKNCPYCNERGLVKFVDKQSGRFEDLPCPHDAQAIQQYAIQKNAKIGTAQPDYQDPTKPSTRGTTRTDGLQPIREILSARDDDVPF